MGKVSKDTAKEQVDAQGFAGSYGETEGYTIGFERYTEHADMTTAVRRPSRRQSASLRTGDTC